MIAVDKLIWKPPFQSPHPITEKDVDLSNTTVKTAAKLTRNTK